jgi:hypothetical protein
MHNDYPMPLIKENKNMTQMESNKGQSHADFFFLLLFGRDSSIAGRHSKGNQAVFSPERAAASY